ncbi:hypothetical protein AVEN_17725-1 [Araneus ventricosus]|uniref:Uncharacterized protein n=1 Tax=Araneus ventricosus TaxID=182803 RepID=A0A4Y2F9Q8_ARAVE|nr:hypothetical protein AVEN_17725-1 [Araneus ventricosus]
MENRTLTLAVSNSQTGNEIKDEPLSGIPYQKVTEILKAIDFLIVIIYRTGAASNFLRFPHRCNSVVHKKFSMHFRKEISQIQQQLLDCNTREQLDKTTSFLQRAIFRCCQKAYKLKKVKQSSKVTWWTQELDIKKKETRAFQKRANSTTCSEQIRYQLLFRRKQALYKILSLRANRTSLSNFCKQTKDPYGIPYKAIVKDNLPPPSDLLRIMDQPEEGDSESFADRILQ